MPGSLGDGRIWDQLISVSTDQLVFDAKLICDAHPNWGSSPHFWYVLHDHLFNLCCILAVSHGTVGTFREEQRRGFYVFVILHTAPDNGRDLLTPPKLPLETCSIGQAALERRQIRAYSPRAGALGVQYHLIVLARFDFKSFLAALQCPVDIALNGSLTGLAITSLQGAFPSIRRLSRS